MWRPKMSQPPQLVTETAAPTLVVIGSEKVRDEDDNNINAVRNIQAQIHHDIVQCC